MKKNYNAHIPVDVIILFKNCDEIVMKLKNNYKLLDYTVVNRSITCPVITDGESQSR